MSNIDGENTQKVSLGELLLNAGTRIVDLEKQSNDQVEIITHLEKELASLREQLAEERELREAYKIEAENYNRHGIDTYEKLLKTQKQLKQKEDEIKILTQDSFNLAKKLVEKEDKNRELVEAIEFLVYTFKIENTEIEKLIKKHKKNLSA